MTPQTPHVTPIRTRLFFASSFALLTLTSGYIYLAAGRSASVRSQPAEYSVGAIVRGTHPGALTAMRRTAHIAFRNLVPGPAYGTLAFVALESPAGPRETTDLTCRRVYESEDVLLCLGQYQGFYSAYVLDERLGVRHLFRTPGVPSRARVSRDGRVGAYTLFTAADSYMSAGFSTRTMLFDTVSGSRVADLEMYEAWKDGEKVHGADFNYWGVTFGRDSSTFFATLSTAGQTYLVEGDVARKRVTVIADGVECPSLSPDETRIAFKKKIDGPQRWRPAVIDLATRAETVIPDTRKLDDQIEWLDNEHVLYAIAETGPTPARSSIWTARADGSQPATLFMADAASPAVVRRGTVPVRTH